MFINTHIWQRITYFKDLNILFVMQLVFRRGAMLTALQTEVLDSSAKRDSHTLADFLTLLCLMVCRYSTWNHLAFLKSPWISNSIISLLSFTEQDIICSFHENWEVSMYCQNVLFYFSPILTFQLNHNNNYK